MIEVEVVESLAHTRHTETDELLFAPLGLAEYLQLYVKQLLDCGRVSGMPCLRSGIKPDIIFRIAFELSQPAFISPDVL